MYGDLAQQRLKTLWKRGSPRAERISARVNVCLFTLLHAHMCVSCVCSATSPGTSAMPPLSQFFTSPLKNMLIQTNLLFPLSPPGMDRRRCSTAAHVHHPQPACLIFHFPPFFTLFYYFKSSLPPTDCYKKLVNKKQQEHACFLCVISTSRLYHKCSLLRDIVGVSTPSHIQRNVPHVASNSHSALR